MDGVELLQKVDFLKGIKKPSETDMEALLLSSEIDTKKRVERAPVILQIRDYDNVGSRYLRLFSLGNFSCLIGKAKSRKTFLIGLLTASVLNTNANSKFKSNLQPGKNMVLYFDTEQGEWDCHNTLMRIEYMAGSGDNMKGYSLREYSPLQRCEIVEYAFNKYADSIAFCVIDGIADLANAINDEDEATRVTTMLLRLTKTYNSHITTIIHQNKNDNYATGHLGSSIMKKAEVLLSVTKNNENKAVSTVNCDLSRSIDFKSFELSINTEGLPEVYEIDERLTRNEKLENAKNELQNNWESKECPF